MARNPLFSSYKHDRNIQRHQPEGGDAPEQRHTGSSSSGSFHAHVPTTIDRGSHSRQNPMTGSGPNQSGPRHQLEARYVPEQRHSGSSSGSSHAHNPSATSKVSYSRQNPVTGSGQNPAGPSQPRGPLSLSRHRPRTSSSNVGAVPQQRPGIEGSDVNRSSNTCSESVSKTTNQSSNSSNGSRSDSNFDNPPPPKRRKTEEIVETSNVEDIWDDDEDDDFALTQAELEKIDVMASQAIATKETSETKTSSLIPAAAISSAEKQSIPASRTVSHPSEPVTTPRTSVGTFLKPKVLISSHSSTSSTSGSAETSHTDSFTTGSGSSSSNRRSSSETIYPNSSSYPSSRNSSLKSSSSGKSGSSVEIIPGQLTRQGSNPTQSESISELSIGALMRSPTSQVLKEELDKYKKECEQLKQQIEKVSVEKEGEIKILRGNLNRKESELSSIRQEKVKGIEKSNREQSEKEKQLQSEVNKLTTQLQFKDRDISNMREKLQTYESRLNASATQHTSPVRSPVMTKVSPKKRKVTQDKSPTPKTGFPTQQSFMADERSPIVPVGRPSTSKETDIENFPKDEGAAGYQVKDESSTKQRKLSLRVNMNKGQLSGASLVANLIEAVPETSDMSTERGIVGLLQHTTSTMDLIPFQFDRDNSNLMLSPIPNKRLNELKYNLTAETAECVPLLSQENYNLALQGLNCLLSEQGQPHTMDRSDRSILPEIESFLETTWSSDSSISTLQSSLSGHSGAVYFLPLLNEYLSHYIDMLVTSVDVVKSPSTPKSSSSSKGSSDLESVTSSLEMLLRTSASYANNLENLAIVSLRILHKLVSHCGTVRDVLLSSKKLLESDADDYVSDIENIPEKETTDMETDQSSLSSLSSSLSGSLSRSIVQPVIELHLLQKIFKLANPGQDGHKYNVHITESALDILIVLSNHVNGVHIERLLPAVTDGIILNGLECESNVNIVLKNVELLYSLVKHSKVLKSVCASSERSEQEGCILCTLYTVCMNAVDKMDDENFIKLTQNVVKCLLNIQSVHESGVAVLINEECDCTWEIVKCIYCSLHRNLQLYDQTNDMSVMQTIRQGLLLIHMIWLKDQALVDNPNQEEYQYVRLLHGLHDIFNMASDFESEFNILNDLWDFGHNDSEQDSEDG